MTEMHRRLSHKRQLDRNAAMYLNHSDIFLLSVRFCQILSDLQGLQGALAILISIIFQRFVRASFAFEGDEHSFAGQGQFLDLTAFAKVVADLFLRGIPGNSCGHSWKIAKVRT